MAIQYPISFSCWHPGGQRQRESRLNHLSNCELVLERDKMAQENSLSCIYK